jgi:hypothetical protein
MAPRSSARIESFLEVAIQDVSRTPLPDGRQNPGLCADVVLAVAKKTHDGASVFNNFNRATVAKGSTAEALLASQGVTLFKAMLIGSRVSRRCIYPEDIPKFLSIVCDTGSALEALCGDNLHQTLIARGLEPEQATALITDQINNLQENPEDKEHVRAVTTLFGADTSAVRYKRVARHDGEGTTVVFAAIDLVMMAKKCSYEAAKKIVWRVFKDYYDFDLDNSVSGGTICTLTYRVRLSDNTHGGGNDSIALNIHGAGELMCLIPGSEISAQFRRKAVDTLLRVEGGDTSLIDRIQANRKFQEYLAEHNPDHPLRVIGEAAEQRHHAEAENEVLRRSEIEAMISHQKLMLELEYTSAKEKKEIEIQKLRYEAEADVHAHKERLESERKERQRKFDEEEDRREDSRLKRIKTSESFMREHQFKMTKMEKEIRDAVESGTITREDADTILGKQRVRIQLPLGTILSNRGFASVLQTCKNFAQRFKLAYLAGDFNPKPSTDWIDGVVSVANGQVIWYDTDLDAMDRFAQKLQTEARQLPPGQTVLSFGV